MKTCPQRCSRRTRRKQYEEIYEECQEFLDEANENRLQLISRSSTKHDVADARILGDLLRTNYLPVAHMRDQETRETLAVVQERANYGLKRGELRGSIRWLLKRRLDRTLHLRPHLHPARCGLTRWGDNQKRELPGFQKVRGHCPKEFLRS